MIRYKHFERLLTNPLVKAYLHSNKDIVQRQFPQINTIEAPKNLKFLIKQENVIPTLVQSFLTIINKK